MTLSDFFSIKSKLGKLTAGTILSAAAVVGVVACDGGSQRNDQGVSFLAMGYYGVPLDDEPVPIAFSEAVLGTDQPFIAASPDGFSPGLAADGQRLIVAMGIQNRLSEQFIRLDRIQCDYWIPGSSLSIPTESMTAGAVLGGAGPFQDESTDAINNEPLAQVFYYPFQIVSTDIVSYINVNRNSLPATPFEMRITCSAFGVTSAGFVFETNKIGFTVFWYETRYEFAQPANDGATTAPATENSLEEEGTTAVEDEAVEEEPTAKPGADSIFDDSFLDQPSGANQAATN